MGTFSVGGPGFSMGAGQSKKGKGGRLGAYTAPDPLADVEYTDDLAEDSARELTAMQSAYRDRAKAEAARFKDATDSEFWFAVCFTSREEKEAFLAAIKVNRRMMGDKYLDGRKLAQVLGIEY